MPSWVDRFRDALLLRGIALGDQLGEGGMGVVYLARDQILERPIAVKVLKPELAGAEAAERFLREARAAARLRHPNVVQVHQYGELGGFFYYTMDYIASPTLEAFLDGRRMAGTEVVRLGRDLLAALSAAHAQGLIHRDVKPSNIFVTPDRALLGDFGIAFAINATRTAATGDAGVRGTLAYISPEQLDGRDPTACTDVYLAGLVLFEATTGRHWMPGANPARGNWRGMPNALRPAIRRAIQVEPEDRWHHAAEFSEALSRAEVDLAQAGSGAPAPPRWLFGAAAAVATAALSGIAIDRLTGGPEGPQPAIPDIVVAPFDASAVGDSTLGGRLSLATGYSLERFTELRIADANLAIRLHHSLASEPASDRLDGVMRGTQSRFGVGASLRPRGAGVEVELYLRSEGGKARFEGTLQGDTTDIGALGDELAQMITQELYPAPKYRRAHPLAPLSRAAQTEFLLGEHHFARGAWLTAERHYVRALEADSTFVLAAWRLGNARRWMPLRAAPPYPTGFRQLFESQRSSLPAVDRLLIEAQFRPSGAERFATYAEARDSAPDDAYVALLYGDELFHRGPLAGRPLDDAIAELGRAVTLDTTFAPAWEHLAWALIRQGDRDGATRALEGLERWAGRSDEAEIPLPMLLRIAYQFRFPGRGSSAGPRGNPLLRDPGVLALGARGAMSFDLPEAQAALAHELTRLAPTADLRASGFVGLGVALMALGRPRAALVAFDSAAMHSSARDEARVEAAEWRVIPAALGVPGLDEAERERGRAVLRGMLAHPILGARAGWALAVDAYAAGDSAGGRWWKERAGVAFAPVLEGMRHAASRRWQEALDTSAPALAADSSGAIPDPFARAALHLLRGEWYAQLGRADEADRSWLWYENLDVRGWPGAELQAGEVDWALATHMRATRSRIALAGGRPDAGCAMARRVRELWADAEPPVLTAFTPVGGTERICRAR